MEQEIQTRIATMLNALDSLDWSTVRAAFAPRVAVDYTSLFGGSAETLASDSLLERWRGLLPGFDATQHLIGPVIVTGNGGGVTTAEAQVRGYHHVSGAEGGAVWMAAGRYRFAMERRDGEWKIAGITFQLAYQEGNLGMPAIAQARVAAGKGRTIAEVEGQTPAR
jgi:SnoaL-like domain